jgi:hypothetical protein
MPRVAETIGVFLALAGGTLALAFVPEGTGPERGASLVAKELSGPLRIKNSKEGRPIVTAPSIIPGDVVRGRVAIRNMGRQGRLAVAPRGLTETPGPYGGLLSEALVLRVMRVPPRRAPARRRKRTVWEGALAEMPKIRLRAWSPGSRRVYKFRVAFPDGGPPSSFGSGDNAYQGSRAEVAFVWR